MQPSTQFHHIQDATSSPSIPSLTDTEHSLTTQSSSPAASSIIINTIISARGGQFTTMEPKQSTLHSLMSPPEPTQFESFTQKTPALMPSNKKIPYGGLPPLSPPISPETKNIATEERPTLAVADPILYPSTERSASSSETPLFPEDDLDAKRVVQEHMAARDSSIFRQASPPRTEEYVLALEFKSTVMGQYIADRQKWLRRERAFLLADKERFSGPVHRRYKHIAPASGMKPHRTPPKNTESRVKKPSPPKPAYPRASPAPGVRPGPREDRDFELLPDYAPPTSSLPSKYNSLKVEWKGAPIDLHGDKDHDKLHPDELLLAANLRLDCATYLTSKRRIFIARVDCLRRGKEFRKTDAQQACKIDVNKASKLWTAFEKVGWLHKDWVKQYL
jgi:hypothetical protein